MLSAQIVDPSFSQLPPQYQIAVFVTYGIILLVGLIQLVAGLILIAKEASLRKQNRNERLMMLKNSLCEAKKEESKSGNIETQSGTNCEQKE